jgi:hypothetical protein
MLMAWTGEESIGEERLGKVLQRFNTIRGDKVEIRIEMTGATPLLMHNARLADPKDQFAKEIAKYSAKKSKKTEEDRDAIERLEWLGGLYVENGVIVEPTSAIGACLREAAKSTRNGRDIQRAVRFKDMFVKLVYDGPSDIEKLFECPEFQNRAIVRIQKARSPRVRPRFFPWYLEAYAILNTNLIDIDKLRDIADYAGEIEGLGDNRINGFGKFKAEIFEV